MKPHLIEGPSGNYRCWWCGEDPLYQKYHDEEWGFPVSDDFRLYEKICLEGFQAGLSWITILKKRENFRKAFKEFNFEKVSRFNQKSVERLLKDKGIVRHRGKIESTINNAKQALKMRDEFGSLGHYFWQWEQPSDFNGLVSSSEESTAMSKDLKKRGWSFVGPTTVYSFMQACGLVNDHLEGCSTRARVEKAKAKFKRP